MKAIILAAGEGKRLNMQSDNFPKCLLKINGKTLLERLLKQLFSKEIDDIKIVVGYKKEMIIDLIRELNINAKIIENDNYKEDTNILSLSLALRDRINSFYLFEADCIFENKCFDLIFDPKYKDKSVWFSKGLLNINQNGGIIKADELGMVQDLRILSKYQKNFRYYNKLIGVMKVGKFQINRFNSLLLKYCEKSTKQYYHIPWIENLCQLESYLCDFGELKATSINNIYQYKFAKRLFKNETC